MINGSHLGTKLTFSGIQEASNVVLHVVFSIFIFLRQIIALFTMMYLE